MYNEFAFLYDTFMSHAPYDKWKRVTKEIIKEHSIQPDTIVDLGCGTGEITLRLAPFAPHVIGVDQSETMLAVASEKNSTDVQWIKQDIHELTGFSHVDLFVSFCDVINYIRTKDELITLFSKVHEGLRSGGYFMFDIHSIHYVETALIGKTFSDIGQDFVYIWECEAGKRRGEMTHYLTFFHREEGEITYKRFDEVHYQQTYTVEQYEYFLQQSGFDNIHFFQDFSLEKQFSEKNSERIFILAQK